MLVWELELPLSSAINGGLGDLYQIGRPSMADRTFDGQRQSVLSSSPVSHSTLFPCAALQTLWDNKGVVEGWWNGCSQNTTVNNVF